MKPQIQAIEAIYLKQGVRLADGQTPTLYSVCSDRNSCWNGAGDKARCEWNNRIHAPYIGTEYNRYRLAILGLNLNAHGGWEALTGMFSAVPELFIQGQRKLFRQKGYSGTLMYHRVTDYARVLTERICLADLLSKQRTGLLADVCHRFAFLNSVKCAPNDEKKCSPINDMQTRCRKRFLMPELAVLMPTTILCLDQGAFTDLVQGDGFSINGQQLANGPLLRQDLTRRDDGGKVLCLYVPHPASMGGSNSGYPRMLLELTDSNYKG